MFTLIMNTGNVIFIFTTVILVPLHHFSGYLPKNQSTKQYFLLVITQQPSYLTPQCVCCSSRWILVEGHKTWSEAQSYCRQNYTDLASIRNLTENEEIKGLISNSSWIGLFRDGWKWSDGSAMSFSKWYHNQPNGGDERCVASHLGKWDDYSCSHRLYFACYSGK
uniref:C-type lectin domain-containing protein n=1 Tax=Myripristis murdjan TaxID=586833 RepID=A0A667WZ46_9TELE